MKTKLIQSVVRKKKKKKSPDKSVLIHRGFIVLFPNRANRLMMVFLPANLCAVFLPANLCAYVLTS